MEFRIVVQARMNSSRLPGKMNRPFFKKKGILQIILERLVEKFQPELIVLATTTNRADDDLIKLANECGVDYFRGSEFDVLSRFIEVGKVYKSEYLVRVCADNPFIMPDFISQLIISSKEDDNFDYIGYKLDDGTPLIKSHLGIAAEVVSMNALKRISDYTSENLYHEHVTNYIYSNPALFNIKWLPLPDLISSRTDIRLTVDTIADFDLMKQLYSELSGTTDLSELVNAVDLNPSMLETMAKQINGNRK
jgi:spore coat polysaccharide biosynthesis protein SpsF